MPCYTVNSVTSLLKIADMNILEKALIRLYGKVERDGDVIRWDRRAQSYDKTTGELRVRNQDAAAVIKKAYAAEIVREKAKKERWELKEISQFKFVIKK